MLSLSQCAYENVARINEDNRKLYHFEYPGSLTPILSNEPVIHKQVSLGRVNIQFIILTKK